MPDLLKRMGAPIVFGVLVLLAIVSMVGDRRARAEGGRELPFWQAIVYEIAAPIQKIVAAPVDTFRELWSSYADLLDVREENERLRARLARTEEENLQYREALVASGNLDRIAGMRDEIEIPLLPSEVVGVEVSPWFRSVLVDRGSSHGVEPGHPVVTPQGVVGLVTATSAHAAKAMLILDRQSSIDALVQRSRTRGVVRGKGGDTLEFEFIARGSDVVPGDLVITSGLGGVFPKGLSLGVVSSVEPAEGRLMQISALEPAVDFGQLEQVFVMLRQGPSMKLLYEPNVPSPSQDPEVAANSGEDPP